MVIIYHTVCNRSLSEIRVGIHLNRIYTIKQTKTRSNPQNGSDVPINITIWCFNSHPQRIRLPVQLVLLDQSVTRYLLHDEYWTEDDDDDNGDDAEDDIDDDEMLSIVVYMFRFSILIFFLLQKWKQTFEWTSE